jgi:hypothetical protein
VDTKASAGQVQNDKQHDQDNADEPKHFHPARCARWAIVGVGAVRVGFQEIPLLLVRVSAGKDLSLNEQRCASI